MAENKFVARNKVRLIKDTIHDGGVYFAGAVLVIEDSVADKWIAEGVAEAFVSEPAKPVVPPAKEKADK